MDVIRMAFVTTVGQVYALIFVLNVVAAFFTPTFEAALPERYGDPLMKGSRVG